MQCSLFLPTGSVGRVGRRRCVPRERGRGNRAGWPSSPWSLLGHSVYCTRVSQGFLHPAILRTTVGRRPSCTKDYRGTGGNQPVPLFHAPFVALPVEKKRARYTTTAIPPRRSSPADSESRFRGQDGSAPPRGRYTGCSAVLVRAVDPIQNGAPLPPVAVYCSFWAGLPAPSVSTDYRRALNSPSAQMGKNGTGWDFFEGFQSHLAMTRNEMLRGSAAQRLIVVSYRCSDYCVVQSGRFRPILSPANRAVEWSEGVR